MPARPPVPNCIQAVVRMEDLTVGHISINKLHFGFSGTADAADLVTFANALFAAYNSHWMSSTDVSHLLSLLDVTCLDLSSATGLEGVSTTGSVLGAGTTISLASMAALINWKISRHYRGGKPKTFLPGLTTAMIGNDQQITTSAQAQAIGLATALALPGGATVLGTYGALTINNMLNVSYFSGFTNYTKSSGRESSRPTLRATPLTDVITNFAVPAQVHTQRRRLLGS